jgi:poly-gamma-glutamate synthesis protein (capsule biosynthesis protein)
MDYGERGVKSTLESLNKNKIKHVGSGLKISDASKYFILQKNDLKIAILNFAENEWSIATEKNAGANPLDIIENCRQIREANLKNDKVICIIHGGHEYYNYPSPNMVKQYKFYVECGADAIIAHHTHCISGFETYKGAPIVYGLGNFIFTLDNPNKEWYKGLIAKLEVTKGENINLSLIPITQEKNTFKLNLLLDNEKEKILNEVQDYSKIISDFNLLNSEWIKFIKLKKNQYLFLINPVQFFNNKYLLSVLRKIRVDKLLLNKKLKTKFLHLIRCEAHQDIILSVLDDE